MLMMQTFCVAAQTDTAAKRTDSITAADSLPLKAKDTALELSSIDRLLHENKFLNAKSDPVSLAVSLKLPGNSEPFFYLLAGLLLFLGCIRVFFSRYFTNLFRVFFNSSLRQSQLTDQLLQAKLPSMLFNIFFIINGGIYIYLLLFREGWINTGDRWILIGFSVCLLGLIYLIKFCTLKFTGWITGYSEQTNTYIFVIFLINKIIGIVLVPFVVLMAFASPHIIHIAIIISLLVAGMMLLLRFFRSYGLLQNQLKVTRFHFFLYIIGIEILPLLLIYKGLVFLLSKNL